MSYPPSYQEKTDHAEITRKLLVDGTLASTNGPLVTDLGGALLTYYVRPAGDNNNDGLTPATAFATLDYFMKQILPAQYMNGGFFVDITGCNEVLPTVSNGSYLLPLANNILLINPLALYFGFQGSLTIHSDMVNFLTIPLANITSVTYDANTDQATLTTTTVLVVNQLVGKKVFQNGVFAGVVKSNTAAVVLIATSSFYLNALSDISFEDPGATLWEMSLQCGLPESFYVIEGIALKTTSFAGVNSIGAAAIAVVCCDVDTFSDSEGGGFDFINCYIKPSVESGNSSNFSSNTAAFNSFYKGVNFTNSSSRIFSSNYASVAFESCGPILFSGNTGVAYCSAYLNQVEFKTSTSNAIVMDGPGICTIDNANIDGSVQSPIQILHEAELYLQGVPAGVGNGGVGVVLVDGARCTAAANVFLRGAGTDDVKIGTMVAQTWASVAAAVGNRVTDLTANLVTGVVTGDGSTAKRLP